MSDSVSTSGSTNNATRNNPIVMSEDENDARSEDTLERYERIMTPDNPDEEDYQYIHEFKTAKNKKHKIKTYTRMFHDYTLIDFPDEDDLEWLQPPMEDPNAGKRATRNPNPLHKYITIEDSDDEKDPDFDVNNYDEKKDRNSNVIP